MLPGVYTAVKKDGTIYYRASITCKNKHISLGSYALESLANQAYTEAEHFLRDAFVPLEYALAHRTALSFDKTVTLINFRDNGVYIKTPIYLRKNYFEYYLTSTLVLKFDIDDLFYYSSHRIQKRGGHLFVSDYGMQYSILSRYGIKNHGVPGKDFLFVNEDPTDYRYSNIKIINPYAGVTRLTENGKTVYQAKIHINGYFSLGIYEQDYLAAIAYNKACDLAKDMGIAKEFPVNYIDFLSASEYADLYSDLILPEKYAAYLSSFLHR